MKRTAIIATLVALSASLFVAISYAQLTQSIDEGSNIDDPTDISTLFKEKIISIRFDRSNALESKSSSASLENASIQEIGGRFFIVGASYFPAGTEYTEYEQFRGVVAGYAWESVSDFKAYSKDQYDEYLRMWKEREED